MGCVLVKQEDDETERASRLYDVAAAVNAFLEVKVIIQRRQQEQRLQFDVSRCQPLTVKAMLDLSLIRKLQRELEDGEAAEAPKGVRGYHSQMLRWQSKLR